MDTTLDQFAIIDDYNRLDPNWKEIMRERNKKLINKMLNRFGMSLKPTVYSALKKNAEEQIDIDTDAGI